ncbi:MAG TPA: DUF1206 domain-containing protein [Thermoanaerobaculia bacterium]|nr:DUF1206 domain-containing protein [Thermoanaerobaculia bacterium]
MARTMNTVEQVGRQAGQAAAGAIRNPWVERLARLGYAARGIVYSLVGILAIQAAFGGRGQTTDTRGAVQKIAQESTALLWLVALGLFGYALWKVIQGVLDPEAKGSDAKGWLQRGAMIVIGLIYGGLAWAAVQMATGNGGSAAGGGSQGFTAEVMAKPFGRWLVALAGIGVIVYALRELRDGWTEKFKQKLKMGEMDPQEQRIATATGKMGLIARGIVFILSGWFLVQAALRFDASQARGLSGALDTLASQPFGPWLLGLVALGLVAFGAYSILEARYRRIVF